MTADLRKDITDKNRKTAVMVCLSASPSNRRVIRSAAKLLETSGSSGVALYVGPDSDHISENVQLYENTRYAASLGFTVNTARSNDLAVTIAEYAKRAGITDLFIGYSAPSHRLFAKKPLSDELIQYLPDVDLHIIPDRLASAFPLLENRETGSLWNLRDLLIVTAVMLGATLISLWFDQSRFSNANIITIYILGVLIASLLTSHQIYGIIASVLYILLFNFLFIDPRYTLLVYNFEYFVTYMVSVAAALMTGSLASRMKSIAHASAENAYQAKVLLDTSRQMEQARSTNDILRTTCIQLVHLLSRTIVYYPYGKDTPDEVFAAENTPVNQNVFEKEKEAVRWTMDNRHQSGAFTSHYDQCRYRYLSIHSERNHYGVIGIDMNGKPLAEFENMILLSILHELTLALENEQILRERRTAEIAAENERLRSGMLRSISHDLRTPLTSIYGNALNLSENEAVLNQEERQQIYDDLVEDSLWLNSQMENILSMTKLENSQYLNLSMENVEDVIDESLRHILPHPNHTIIVSEPDEIYYANMDAKMIVQVLINLLNNAIKYTPDGSTIQVSTEAKDNLIWISVADNGDGISDDDKQHIFELFYTGSHHLSDGYRSMGIGLNLCEMIIRAHQGTISVSDNKPKGTVFRFSLVQRKVDAYE